MATTNTTDMLFSIPPPAQKDDTHKTYAVSIAIIVLSFFTCIFVAIRLTHRFRTKTVGLDDYAMILALVRRPTQAARHLKLYSTAGLLLIHDLRSFILAGHFSQSISFWERESGSP
jgi:hypothetical protein